MIDAVDELTKSVRRLATQLEFLFHRTTQINAYIAVGSTHGFPVHADPHDVMVFQTKGRKLWRVYEYCDSETISPNKKSSPKALAFEGILNEGDLLYIPKGWEHEAIPLGEATIHLSAGVDQPNAKDYVLWVLNRMDHTKLFSSPISSVQGVAPEKPYSDELLSALADGVGRFSVDLFLTEYAKKSARERVQMSLPTLPLPVFKRGESLSSIEE
ncbi:JmjC domain-containing protein [Paraburkholderia sp. GAS199]|uniref:JmjC domain-containing protein n=1 Tax=Paraburkholderia sp. GAS199 TaxID=3035126 RepID=UPI003D1B0884